MKLHRRIIAIIMASVTAFSAGDQVKQGDLLMEADLDQIREAGLNIISPVVVCNTDDYSQISLLKEGGVSPDEAVLKVE